MSNSEPRAQLSSRDRAVCFLYEGRCPFPLLRVPAPGEIDAGHRATCRCGKRVAVTARGLFAHHKPARFVCLSEVR